MIELLDVTFTIPVRIDTADRYRNLKTVISYIKKYFNTKIIIYECDAAQKIDLKDITGCTHMFEKSDNPYFHRTRILNAMTKYSKTPYVVNYDVDVLFKPQQYEDSVKLLRSGIAEMVFPYAGKFYDIHQQHVDKVCSDLSIEHINVDTMAGLNHPNSVGGAIFWNKAKLTDIGMENENFMTWGFEDNERVIRAEKLGTKIKRVDGHLYHLCHARGPNSTQNHPYYVNNHNEYAKIAGMHPQTLRNYVNTWSWIKP